MCFGYLRLTRPLLICLLAGVWLCVFPSLAPHCLPHFARLLICSILGVKPFWLLFGFCVASFLLSTCLSNTATAIMVRRKNKGPCKEHALTVLERARERASKSDSTWEARSLRAACVVRSVSSNPALSGVSPLLDIILPYPRHVFMSQHHDERP